MSTNTTTPQGPTPAARSTPGPDSIATALAELLPLCRPTLLIEDKPFSDKIHAARVALQAYHAHRAAHPDERDRIDQIGMGLQIQHLKMNYDHVMKRAVNAEADLRAGEAVRDDLRAKLYTTESDLEKARRERDEARLDSEPTQTTSEPPTLHEAIERARESSRVAEIDLRQAFAVANQDKANRVPAHVLYRLVEDLFPVVTRIYSFAEAMRGGE